MAQVRITVTGLLWLLTLPAQASAFDIEGNGVPARTFLDAVKNAQEDAHKNCGVYGYKEIVIEKPCASATIEFTVKGVVQTIQSFKCYYKAKCNDSSQDENVKNDPLVSR